MDPKKLPNEFKSKTDKSLIPYPSDYISTIIEKATDTNNDAIIDNYSKFLIRNRRKKQRSKRRKQYSFSQSTTISQNSSHDDNFDDDEQSIQSMPLLYSNNNASQTIHESNDSISNQINVELNLNNIIKRLREKMDQSTQTTQNYDVEKCNQYIQVNIPSAMDASKINQNSNHSNQALRMQLSQLTFIIEEMSKERSNRDIYIHELQKKLASLEKQAKQSSDALNAMMNQSKAAEIDRYQQEISTLQAENKNLRQNLKEIQSTVSKDEFDLVQNENVRLKNDLFQCQQINANLISIQRDNCKFSNQNLPVLKAKLSNLQSNFKQLQQQFNAFRQKIFDMKNNRCVVEIMQQISRKSLEIQSINQTQMSTVQSILRETTESNQHLQLELAKSQEKIIEMTKIIENISKFENENLCLKNSLAKINEDYQIIKYEYEQISVQNENLNRQNEILRKETQEMQTLIEEIEKSKKESNLMDDLRKEIENIKSEKLELQKQINELQAKIARFNSEENIANQQQSILNERIQSLEAELSKEKERSKGLSLTLAKLTLNKQRSENLQSDDTNRKPLNRIRCRMEEFRNEFDNFKKVLIDRQQNDSLQ